MAQRASHTAHRHAWRPVVVGFAVLLVAVLAASAFMLQPAVASRDVDSTTIGIGPQRSTATDAQVSMAHGRIQGQDIDSSSLAVSSARTITVKDPDPVIVISGYDNTNIHTQEAALKLGTTDPLPTAPHLFPDEGDGWKAGKASAYSFADNDDGKGNFGTDVTASGIPLTSNGYTVAVPESQSYLIGSAVAVRYGETIIVATVTDTGGFAGYGRDLDLAPGCWKAFGASAVGDWGVRTVYYKFL